MLRFLVSISFLVSIGVGSIAFVPMGWAEPRSSSQDPITIETFRDFSRLTIKTNPDVQSDWKIDQKGFTLTLKEIELIDLGAPFGRESRWLDQYQDLRDMRLSSLKVTQGREGVLLTGNWKFPSGEQELVTPMMEHFEYRKQSPSRIVIDFWVKKGLTVSELNRKKIEEKKKSTREKKVALKKAKKVIATRGIASILKVKKKLYSEIYCENPMSEKEDIFLPYYPLKRKLDLSTWFPIRKADHGYTYRPPQGGGKEEEHVRLATDLYQKGKFGLALRAYDFFAKDYPSSKYLNDMKFIRANSYVGLNLEKKAEKIYDELIFHAKGSPPALYAGMFLAARTFNEEEYLSALEKFLWLIQNYSEHRLNWVFHIGAAESLTRLKQTERAVKEYLWVVDHAPDQMAKAEAGLRVGDLYLERQQYEQALAAYYKFISQFKKESQNFPEVHLNRAEALYWLKQYDRSEQEFKNFLAVFPSHSEGWRATLRLSEIQGRREGQSRQAQTKWLHETINRFPSSPGKILARLYLQACGEHGVTSKEGVDRFFKQELPQLKAEQDVRLNQLDDLVYLSRARGLVNSGRKEEGIQFIAQKLDSKLSEKVKTLFIREFGRLFTELLTERIQSKKKYEALTFFDQYFRFVEKSDHTDTLRPLLKLSRAATDMGLNRAALQIAKLSKDAAEDLIKSENKKYEAEGASKSSSDELVRKFKKDILYSEVYFTIAKAIWKKSGVEETAQVQSLLEKVIPESEFRQESDLILSLLYAENKNISKAKEIAQESKLKYFSHSPTLDFWLVSLHQKNGDTQSAINGLKKLRNVKGGNSREETPFTQLGYPLLPTQKERIFLEANLLERQKMWTDAADLYKDLLEKGPESNEILYSYARALQKTGIDKNLKEAQAALRKIADQPEKGFWRGLASEILEE